MASNDINFESYEQIYKRDAIYYNIVFILLKKKTKNSISWTDLVQIVLLTSSFSLLKLNDQ
jgi:hypothetical protein